MRPDPDRNGYLEALSGESGLFMRLYAIGGTCVIAFLLALALFTLAL
jgi:hypothetical protein